MDTNSIAEYNMVNLSHNSYSGRGIVIGRDTEGNFIEVYWITGRSEGSRNRIFKADSGRIFTDVADPSKKSGNPDLVIYNAMLEKSSFGTDYFIVSNGRQTDSVAEDLSSSNNRGGRLLDSLRSFDYKYEPDEPNFTPRITGLWKIARSLGIAQAQMAILKKSPCNKSCVQAEYGFPEISPGFGYYVSTYSGNGEPLPSFEGEPKLVLLEGGIDQIMDTYWKLLDGENMVSLAVKSIPGFHGQAGKSTLKIKNKYEEVTAT